MSRKIKKINSSQYKEIVSGMNQESVFIAEIDGKKVNNLNEYFEAVWKAFHFPNTGYLNYYAYLDWIRDLDWLNSKGYVFAIHNSDNLLRASLHERKIILDSLEEEVIPWWESKVEQYQVEGKIKPFAVYLID